MKCYGGHLTQCAQGIPSVGRSTYDGNFHYQLIIPKKLNFEFEPLGLTQVIFRHPGANSKSIFFPIKAYHASFQVTFCDTTAGIEIIFRTG